MPTPNFNLPLYGPGDTAALDTLLNGQSTAIDTAMQQLWLDTGVPTSDFRHEGRVGTTPTGIVYPANASNPTELVVKTGLLQSATTVAFGNEYFPVVTFTTPFPNAIVSIFATPLMNSPITQSTGTIVIDSLGTTQFRAVITSSPNPWIRGFVWTAFGY